MFDRILITGGGGMLATALKASLVTRGFSFVAADHAALDITREQSINEIFERVKPTLVFNCAAHTKVDLCEQQQDLADQINGHAVGTLATLCKTHGSRLVHYSTDFVFDGHGIVEAGQVRPYRIDDPVGPLSAYGRSKLLGEQQLQHVNPPGWIILRTAWLYGRGGPCFPATMIKLARDGKPLRVVSDQTGSPTHTVDLAEASLDLLTAGASGLFHATNSGQVTWFDFTRAILNEFDVQTDLQPITTADWIKLKPSSAHRPTYSVLDLSPLERAINRRMRPWQDALHDYRLDVDRATSST